MRSLVYQHVSEAVGAILAEAPPPEKCGHSFDLQSSLIEKALKYQQDKDLIAGPIRDAWFLGYWSIRANLQLSEKSARNLVTPANRMHDEFWTGAKKELSAELGETNPDFMYLPLRMIIVDTKTGVASYSTRAESVLKRKYGDQTNEIEGSSGCPHGIAGMSKFLLQYLEFMTTHIKQQEPAPAPNVPAGRMYVIVDR